MPVILEGKMIEYKNPFCIRWDKLNCPVPLTIESYWACEADCHHCPGRKLNEIWGKEQRVTDPEKVERKLTNALRNKTPKSDIAVALKKKKTIWLGRKSDPYQPIENEMKITKQIVETLWCLDWSYIVCSRYTENMERDFGLYLTSKAHLLIEITPGGESDWELFERKRTTPIPDRLKSIQRWIKEGLNVGVRGEPFIPGYHTTIEFRDMLKRIKSYGVKSYNTYNLHLNKYNAKRLHAIGLDIERIWEHNQDRWWKPIQRKLCQIADEEGITLGCPDFVNVPKGWKSQTNTCCGVSVPRPFRFNTHHWRHLLQNGHPPTEVLEKTWEGIGSDEEKEKAKVIMFDKSKDIYTMGDAEL